MNISKLFKKISVLCFSLLWIPFIILMVKLSTGEFSEVNPEMVYGIPTPLAPWIISTIALALAGFIFLIAGFIAGGMAIRKILNEGRSAQAKILSVQDSGTRINENPVLLLTLEVKSSDQGNFTAEAKKLVSIIDLDTYKVGKMVEVKYLPGTQKVALV